MQFMKLILVALIILLLMVPAYGQQAVGNVSSNLLQGLAGLTMPVYGQQTVEYWFNKGNGFFDNGVYDLAIKCYDEVILIDPNHATAWNNKGYALYSQGNFDAAIKAYDEALRLNPNFAAAQNNKVLALGRLGQRAEPAMYSDPWMNSQPSDGATGHTYHGTRTPPSSSTTVGNVGANYLANLDTKVYHYPSCAWAEKILPENRIWFSNPNEARSAGYRSCEKCNPP